MRTELDVYVFIVMQYRQNITITIVLSVFVLLSIFRYSD